MWPAAAAAALFVVCGGLLGWALVLNNRLDDRDDQLARSRTLLEAVSSSSRVLTMEGTDAAPDVDAALVLGEQGGVAVIANNGPAPESGQGYHLWLFRDGEAQYAGLLEPDDEGDVLVALEANIDEYDAMEVDLQPLASTAPGGTTVLEGAFD
jgi:hypothetical protein